MRSNERMSSNTFVVIVCLSVIAFVALVVLFAGDPTDVQPHTRATPTTATAVAAPLSNAILIDTTVAQLLVNFGVRDARKIVIEKRLGKHTYTVRTADDHRLAKIWSDPGKVRSGPPSWFELQTPSGSSMRMVRDPLTNVYSVDCDLSAADTDKKPHLCYLGPEARLILVYDLSEALARLTPVSPQEGR